MKVIRGHNCESLKFYNYNTQKIQSDIWSELEDGLWRNFSIENALYNDAVGEVEQNKWKPIFPDFQVINMGYTWDFEENSVAEILYKPKRQNATISSFLDSAEAFFNKYRNKKIGVHLSGGFDSSLIICLMEYFKIPFVAIGLSSDRFEFRTEKHIQKILAEKADDALLLDFENYPFYGNLDKKPKHQVPDSCLKMIDASFALANAFASKGCDVVFSGQGGDTLFVDNIDWDAFKGYNIGNEFLFPWEQEFIYRPLGIELVSMFSDTGIIDQITSLRTGEKEDPLKIWSRKFFSRFLPPELSQFTYTADFFGLSMSGLEKAKPTIKLLFEEAYDYIKHPIFSAKEIKRMLRTDVFSLEYKTYCELCTKISIATWLHSLFRKDD